VGLVKDIPSYLKMYAGLIVLLGSGLGTGSVLRLSALLDFLSITEYVGPLALPTRTMLVISVNAYRDIIELEIPVFSAQSAPILMPLPLHAPLSVVTTLIIWTVSATAILDIMLLAKYVACVLMAQNTIAKHYPVTVYAGRRKLMTMANVSA
jgi:hypothetical protein